MPPKPDQRKAPSTPAAVDHSHHDARTRRSHLFHAAVERVLRDYRYICRRYCDALTEVHQRVADLDHRPPAVYAPIVRPMPLKQLEGLAVMDKLLAAHAAMLNTNNLVDALGTKAAQLHESGLEVGSSLSNVSQHTLHTHCVHTYLTVLDLSAFTCMTHIQVLSLIVESTIATAWSLSSASWACATAASLFSLADASWLSNPLGDSYGVQ